MAIGDKILYYLEKHEMQQKELAEKICIDPAVLNRIVKNRRPVRSDELEAIANVFHVPADALLERDDPITFVGPLSKEKPIKKPVSGEPVTMIPIYGRVVAGDPCEPVQDIIGYTPITEHEARQGEYFALKACGASMEPTFSDGDILIVKKQETVDDGQIAIVLIGDEATVKRIYCDERGVSIIADNAAVFRPRLYTNEEAETLPIRILGRVVKVTRDV